ncbi:MAG: 12-oxophytodienoate reductase, partial [Betaproteobacteria bacterium]|nr:12-oxophytodienoate reductase [Betaproteobacteria bacterium]
GKPVITVGSVGLTGEFIAAFRGEASQPASLDALIERFERGDFDLVAVGRALISDPAWASKVRRGQWDDLAAFDPASLALLH